MSFKRLDPEDISISAESVVAPAWTGQQTTLTTFFTSSNQVATTSGLYYYDVYQSQVGGTGATVQFSVAYGNRLGSGSANINTGVDGKTPSAITYGQYRTLINGDENTDFTFGTATPNSIYTIAVNRSRFKEKLLPGTFSLTLTSGSNSITITDDSKVANTVSYIDAGRVYNLISGSAGTAVTTFNTSGHTFNSGSYGKLYPDVGILVLNGDALGAPAASGGLALNISTLPDTTTGNLSLIYNAINAGANFTLQSEETITSNYVFVRVRNSEYNYSMNPSNISGSGELRWDVMVNTPQTYITTVGLYNDNNDLLGVAKLSRPLLKDFTKEALVRIKLDY
tara:strand:- start:737 stop:1753 length:1017 start_codon:yes stop_codon:yes gene_type:complete